MSSSIHDQARSLAPHAGPAGGAWSRIRRASLRLWQYLECWSERRRQRRQLRRLGDHILKDIGLSRADVEREADKPFWRS